MADQAELTGRQFLIRIFLRSAAGLVAGTALVYGADFLVLQYRISANKNAYGTVTVHPYYAVPRKDGKTELMFDEPTDQACVNSLFPHKNDSPCWYLRKHTDQEIDM